MCYQFWLTHKYINIYKYHNIYLREYDNTFIDFTAKSCVTMYGHIPYNYHENNLDIITKSLFSIELCNDNYYKNKTHWILSNSSKLSKKK